MSSMIALEISCILNLVLTVALNHVLWQSGFRQLKNEAERTTTFPLFRLAVGKRYWSNRGPPKSENIILANNTFPVEDSR